VKNLAEKWPKVDVLAILADDFGHSPRPVGAPSLRAAFRNQSARVIFATGACLSYKKKRALQSAEPQKNLREPQPSPAQAAARSRPANSYRAPMLTRLRAPQTPS